MLEFANLEKVDPPKKVDNIFRRHAPRLKIVNHNGRPLLSRFWNPLHKDDFHGIASLVDLRDDTRERLEKIIAGEIGARKKILRKVVTEAKDASAQASVQGVINIPLPCAPEIVIERDAVTVQKKWFVTGAHIAVTLGLLELFVDGLLDRLARCKNCERFYFKTAKCRVACSPECRRKLRLKDIAHNVKQFRRRQRRG
jgi:hypothetical protein